MRDFISSLQNAAPAIVMMAGIAPMVAPDAPEHVRYGGACLLAIAAILADIQNGKKLGYTDKIVKAVQKIPGMENADTGTVIGALTLGASAFLGGGEAMNMAQSGITSPGLVKVGYNAISYPLSSAFDFQRSRILMERYFGKELSFKYQNADGKTQTTTPIPTSRLLQQLALISGAGGITAYGSMLDVQAIQFTGIMFAASNGMNITNLVKQPLGEATQAKIEKLRKYLANNAEIKNNTAPVITEQWKEAQNALTADSPVASTDQPPPTLNTQTLAKQTAEAITPIIAKSYQSPDKEHRI